MLYVAARLGESFAEVRCSSLEDKLFFCRPRLHCTPLRVRLVLARRRRRRAARGYVVVVVVVVATSRGESFGAHFPDKCLGSAVAGRCRVEENLKLLRTYADSLWRGVYIEL